MTIAISQIFRIFAGSAWYKFYVQPVWLRNRSHLHAQEDKGTRVVSKELEKQFYYHIKNRPPLKPDNARLSSLPLPLVEVRRNKYKCEEGSDYHFRVPGVTSSRQSRAPTTRFTHALFSTDTIVRYCTIVETTDAM